MSKELERTLIIYLRWMLLFFFLLMAIVVAFFIFRMKEQARLGVAQQQYWQRMTEQVGRPILIEQRYFSPQKLDE